MEKINQINWFPGHMKKATDEIIKKLKMVDLIIEVVDGRCIISSSNSQLKQLVYNKPILTVALKSDLSNYKSNNDQNTIIGNIKNKEFKNLILKKMYKILEDKFNNFLKKGVVNPKFIVMVIGLPNVGKSSLINFLKNKNNLIVKNMPGVTKTQKLVNINKNFDLIDTPGILFKKIDDIKTGYKLALINCIKKEILPIDDVLRFGFEHYKKYHLNELLNYYKINDVVDYFDFQNKVCIKFNFFNYESKFDLNRFYNMVFNDFSLSKIAKTNFDIDLINQI